jgi:hypothetical protein
MTNQAMPATTKRASATLPIPIPTFPPIPNPLAVGLVEAGDDITGAGEALVVAEAVPLADVGFEEVEVGDKLT